MTKHRLGETIKSFFGSHIDPEKDEQLKETKFDIDSKVEKILKLIKEEGQDETDGIPVGNLKKEPLVDLIEDFHKQYHSLYARYDHLTGKLREKAHSKQEKEDSSSSSSSSESEAEYPFKRKGSKNGKVDGDFQEVMDGILQELQTASLEIADLKRKLTATTEENQALESKLQETETTIKDMNIGSERLENDKSKLLVQNEDLNLNTASKIEGELNQKLEDLIRDKENLITEKETATRRIEEEEKIMGDLKATADQLIDERETIKLELEAVKQDLETARQEVTDLSLTQKTTKEENNSLAVRIIEISDEIKQAQNMIQGLVAESGQLKEKLEGRERELYSLTEKHEVHQNEALDQIKGLEAQVTGFEVELNYLNGEKREMETRIENAATEAKLLKEEKLGLQDRILQLEMTSKEKIDEIAMLVKKFEDNENISSSKIEELTAQINNLRLEVDSLRIQKGELEEQMVHKGNEAEAQVKDLMDQINLLQEELDSLHSQRSQSEMHVEKKTREISEHLIQIEILKQELSSHAADQQRFLEEKEGFTAQVKGLEEELDSLSKQRSELEEQLRFKDNEINQLSKERDSLQAEKCELEELLAGKSNEVSDQIRGLADQVNAMEHKLESLQSQNSRSESELMKRTQEISEYMIMIENMKEEIATKTRDHRIVLEHKEGLTVKVKDLEGELESLHSQKSELEEQIRTMNHETNQLREEKEEQENTLIERSNELLSLQKKHDHEREKASAQIMALAEQLNDLQQELNSLHTQKSQLELQIEKQKQESSESLEQAENQIIELTSRVEVLQRKLKEQEDAFDKLTEEYKQVQNWFQECKENLTVTERTMEEKAEDFRRIIDSKDQMLADLERMVEDLKGDLEVKSDELGTLVENARNVEVKLRLSNQKLRVTDQLLTEKEESHKTAEQRFQQKHRLLEERTATLSGIIASNNKAHIRIITDISEKVNDTMDGLESVVKKFEEDYGIYENRVSEVTEELCIAKNWVVTMNHEKEQLKKEVCILVEQLKEKKDQESVLREKVGWLELKASKEQAEIEKLAKVTGQLEKKVGLYEEMMKETDERMLSLGEEKREAIRQLCLSIDFHRSRCDYLKEVLSKMPTVRTRRSN